MGLTRICWTEVLLSLSPVTLTVPRQPLWPRLHLPRHSFKVSHLSFEGPPALPVLTLSFLQPQPGPCSLLRSKTPFPSILCSGATSKCTSWGAAHPPEGLRPSGPGAQVPGKAQSKVQACPSLGCASLLSHPCGLRANCRRLARSGDRSDASGVTVSRPFHRTSLEYRAQSKHTHG